MNSRTPSMFSNRTIGFYLGLAAGVMAIVSLVAYAMYAVAAGSYNVWVIAPLVLVVLAQAATIPLDNDWLIAVTPAIGMIAWCRRSCVSVSRLPALRHLSDVVRAKGRHDRSCARMTTFLRERL